MTRKAPTKSVSASKTSKMKTKKTTAKKAVKKKAAPKRTPISVSQLDEKPKAVPIKDDTKSGSISAPIIREKLEIALLSPFRFPINYDRLATQTARYSGIFFVIVGAFFTLSNIQQLDGFYTTIENTSHLAAVCDPLDQDFDPDYCGGETDSGDVCDTASIEYDPYLCGQIEEPEINPDIYCSEHVNYYDSLCADHVNIKPSVNFIHDSSLSGITTLGFSVEHAGELEVKAYEKSSGDTHVLGDASLDPGSNHWTYSWDTTSEEYPNGEYKIKAYVTNGYGQYPNVDPNYVMVQNSNEAGLNCDDPYSDEYYSADLCGYTGSVCDSALDPDYTEEECGLIDATSCNDPYSEDYYSTDLCGYTGTPCDHIEYPFYNDEAYCPVDSEEDPIVDLVIREFSPVDGDVKIEVSSNSTGEAKLKIKERVTGDIIYYDGISSTGEGEWEYVWDTELVTDGGYDLYAFVTIDGTEYSDGPLGTMVDNSDAENQTADEPTDDTLPDTDTQTDLEPETHIKLLQDGTLSGRADIIVDVEGAGSVELYAKPKNTLTDYYLGQAQKKDDAKWKFVWETHEIPNNAYYIFAKIQNQYGEYKSRQITALVYNEPKEEYTPVKETYVEELEDAKTFIEEQYDEVLEETTLTEPVFVKPPPPVIDTTEDFIEEATFDDSDLKEETEILLDTFRTELRTELDRLAVAIRNGDEQKILTIRERISDLRQRVLSSILSLNGSADIIEQIDKHLNEVIRALEDLTERNEEIIKDRVGDAVFDDTDKDGISDYDEVNLYETDPFSADSDNDGFTDGSEILGGFNPNNSAAEALVVYESPKDEGVVREDIFGIDSIETKEREVAGVVKPVAVLSGRGLPNSFVTLYIFSTPIIVTVKTNDDGSWSYTFDKELEDGDHEVYVGVTDNAGRIVAKSNPLPFVKTAEAFAPVDASAGATINPSQSDGPAILSDNVILIILSILVVALGLVLMLLGMHMQSREPRLVQTA